MRSASRLLGLIGVMAAIVMGCKVRAPGENATEILADQTPTFWQGQVTVMSYNIAAPQRPDLDVIAREIKASKADVVGLQEVDSLTLRNFKDMAGELGKRTGMHVVFEAARWTMGGRTGNAILSRWPIKSHEAIKYPHVDDIPDPTGVCTSKYREQRIGLAATIQVAPDETIVFATTHFGHCLLEQQAAVQVLGQKLDVKGPLILVGDFNAKLVAKDGTPGAVAKGFSDLGLRDAQTNPSQKLPEGVKQRIDWILHSPCWKAHDFAQGELTTSDHRPVTARLESTCRHPEHSPG